MIWVHNTAKTTPHALDLTEGEISKRSMQHKADGLSARETHK